jgi:hypothetical protein
MNKCGVNACGKATSSMIYRFKASKSETLYNVWVCDECYERRVKNE